MTATRYSRRDASDHEFSTSGGIFKDRHMGVDNGLLNYTDENQKRLLDMKCKIDPDWVSPEAKERWDKMCASSHAPSSCP